MESFICAGVSQEPIIVYDTNGYNTNACEAGLLVSTVDECMAAARRLGANFQEAGSWEHSTKGCHVNTDKTNLFFNTHGSGAAQEIYAPVCTIDMTPANPGDEHM
jgi:hypothetical protein